MLLIDLDPQGNASSSVGFVRGAVEHGTYELLMGASTVGDVVAKTDLPMLDVVPSSADLAGAEVELVDVEGRETVLRRALAPIRDAAKYEYVLLDCPPSLGLLTVNALVAADTVLIPMQAKYFSLEGLGALNSTIEAVRAALNPALAIEGIVFCMFDPRTNLAQQVVQGGQRTLRRARLQDEDPGQYPAVGEPQPRQAVPALRHREQGRAGPTSSSRVRCCHGTRRRCSARGAPLAKPKRQALGRGLGGAAALVAAPRAQTRRPRPRPTRAPQIARSPIEQLAPNPAQPRRHFDPTKLAELAQSIKAHGIIQPIVVRPHAEEAGKPRRYQIIAGERRWRAAQKAGLHSVPVVLRDDIEKEDELELALIENIQRADLNPIEEAKAYYDLARLRSYTQEELAKRVGKDRSTIANALRLLKLPPKVQQLVIEGKLSMGHARALLGLATEDAITALATEVVRDSLSVRATERAVRKRAEEAPKAPQDEELERRKIIVGELETRLRRRLGVQVRLNTGGKKDRGTVEIPYGSLDELDRLLRVILGDPGGVG